MVSSPSLTTKDIALLGVAGIAIALAVGLAINTQQISFAQNATGEVVVEADEVELLLENVNTTFVAVSGLISTATAIIVYILNAIRSKTGDKIVSTDMYNKTLDVLAQVRQKDNELRDVYRQVLENKEVLKVSLDMVKSTNPEVAKKIDEALPMANKAIQTEVMPKIDEWQKQADRFYDTLLKKTPVVTKT